MKLGDFNVYGAPPAMEKVMLARDAFIDKYCADKGWTKASLTIEQILEIRAQDGWKNPKL